MAMIYVPAHCDTHLHTYHQWGHYLILTVTSYITCVISCCQQQLDVHHYTEMVSCPQSLCIWHSQCKCHPLWLYTAQHAHCMWYPCLTPKPSHTTDIFHCNNNPLSCTLPQTIHFQQSHFPSGGTRHHHTLSHMAQTHTCPAST